MPKIINFGFRQTQAPRKFTERELFDAIERHGLIVPVFELIHYGRKCHWRRKDGKPFFSVDGFAKAYNEVYKKRLAYQKEKQRNYEPVPDNWKTEGIVINGVRCFPVYRDEKGYLIS